jgi:hypothetical protein
MAMQAAFCGALSVKLYITNKQDRFILRAFQGENAQKGFIVSIAI